MGYIMEPYEAESSRERRREAWLERLPVCENCGLPIQQSKAIYYNDQWFCESCEYDAWNNCIRDDFEEAVPGYDT